MNAAQEDSNFFEKIQSIFVNFSTKWDDYLLILIQIVLIIIASKILLTVISGITGYLIRRNKAMPDEKRKPRLESSMTLLRSSARYIVFFSVIIAVFLLLGMENAVNSVINMAGIGALAIGFGAQSLVKDVVSGLFLNFENQFAVGDYVKFDDAEGVVEAMALRVTYIRSFKGDQIIVPNGSIGRVLNYSRGGSIAVVDVRTTYESNTHSLLELLDYTLVQWAEDNHDLILEAPKVLGINAFDDSGCKIRIICKAKPMLQWDVERSIRLTIKETFDATGIRFAYPHMIIHSEDDNFGHPTIKHDSHKVDKANNSERRKRPVWQRERINLEGGDTDDY